MTGHHSPRTTRRQFLSSTVGMAVASNGRTVAQDVGGDEEDGGGTGFTPFVPGQELASLAGQVASYIVDKIDDINPFTGATVDADAYTDLEARETHVAIYADAKEMAFYDEEIITNVENLLTFAPNKLVASQNRLEYEYRWSSPTTVSLELPR